MIYYRSIAGHRYNAKILLRHLDGRADLEVDDGCGHPVQLTNVNPGDRPGCFVEGEDGEEAKTA